VKTDERCGCSWKVAYFCGSRAKTRKIVKQTVVIRLTQSDRFENMQLNDLTELDVLE